MLCITKRDITTSQSPKLRWSAKSISPVTSIDPSLKQLRQKRWWNIYFRRRRQHKESQPFLLKLYWLCLLQSPPCAPKGPPRSGRASRPPDSCSLLARLRSLRTRFSCSHGMLSTPHYHPHQHKERPTLHLQQPLCAAQSKAWQSREQYLR